MARPSSTDHDRRASLEIGSFKATIVSLLFNKITLAVTAIGTVATIVSLGSCGPDPGAAQSIVGSSNACAQVSNNASCEVNNYGAQRDEADAKSATDDDFLRELRARPEASTPPVGSGPWPFVVFDTGIEGLFARNDYHGVSDRVGTAPNRQLVWADCEVDSNEKPAVDGRNDVGGRWLKVRWKHLANGSLRGNSEPTETQTAWMYRGFLEPLSHNGEIPSC